MKYLIYILLTISSFLLLFQIYLVFSDQLYVEKLESYAKQAPISAYYKNHTLTLYNKGYYIQKIESLTNEQIVNSSNATISITWDSCPTALRAYTNKGIYKIYYIKCA